MLGRCAAIGKETPGEPVAVCLCALLLGGTQTGCVNRPCNDGSWGGIILIKGLLPYSNLLASIDKTAAEMLSITQCDVEEKSRIWRTHLKLHWTRKEIVPRGSKSSAGL